MKKIKRKFPLFGGIIEIGALVVDDNIINSAYQEGLRLEKIFNIYDPESEISQLNKSREIKVSKELIGLLKITLRSSGESLGDSLGDYDITKGKNFLERKSGKKLSKLKCSYKDVLIRRGKVKLLHKDILLDLGSVAKGYITDRMVEVLISGGARQGLIDSRGDIRVFGEEEQIISLRHPRKKDKNFCSLVLKNSSIATSGDYEQYTKDFNSSHLLNKKYFISVSVVAPTLTEADLYATMLSVVSGELAEEILKYNDKLKVLAVDKNLVVHDYNNFKELMVKVKENGKD